MIPLASTAARPQPPSDSTDAATHDTISSCEFINFAVGNEQYGVHITSVREIKEWSNVTYLPRQPEYVRGVLNLRGIVMPIIDVRCRFGQGLTECTPTHIIIIVQTDGGQVGLLADRVLDIVSCEPDQLQSLPPVARSSHARFLAGLVTVEDAMIALIDLERLLADGAEDAESLGVLSA
jgi:purine-binding chemotaxis protein CheW